MLTLLLLTWMYCSSSASTSAYNTYVSLLSDDNDSDAEPEVQLACLASLTNSRFVSCNCCKNFCPCFCFLVCIHVSCWWFLAMQLCDLETKVSKLECTRVNVANVSVSIR